MRREVALRKYSEGRQGPLRREVAESGVKGATAVEVVVVVVALTAAAAVVVVAVIAVAAAATEVVAAVRLS